MGLLQKSICAVIFDYGLVLSGPPDPAAWASMQRLLRVPEPALQAAYWHLRDAYDLGQLGGSTYWLAVAESLDRKLDTPTVALLLEADITLWAQPNQAMIAWAQQMQAAGVATAILSNLGDAMESGLRARLPWLNGFAPAVFSHALGLRKPDPPIYRHMLRELRVDPSETLFIDDRAVNVQAARALGLNAIEYRDHAAFLRELALLPGIVSAR